MKIQRNIKENNITIHLKPIQEEYQEIYYYYLNYSFLTTNNLIFLTIKLLVMI